MHTEGSGKLNISMQLVATSLDIVLNIFMNAPTTTYFIGGPRINASTDLINYVSCLFDWQEVELHEEPECQRVFSAFLEFLYTCHVPLTPETALPMLVLADKYDVVDLREVCIRYARANVIPKLQLKDVFHVWFQYATRYEA